MFNIVLYAPEIPANTGNIGRTCVVAGARLHLVEPLGFSLDDKTVRRAGLGYWQNLDVTTYANWEDFLARNGLSPADGRLHLLTKKARRAEDSHEAILQQDICGNFVNPDDYRISALNLSNSAAIVLYEALRQTGFPGM